jgi:spore coat polysaccharide biosynthesis protein SpsF
MSESQTPTYHRRVVAIVQARMNSARLPGKVLLDIGGKPMLARVVERSRRARTLDEVLVATTTDPTDDAVEAYCQKAGYASTRGSTFDVLDRYYQAAKEFKADVIVRITADCPVIDPDVIDKTVLAFFGLEDETSALHAEAAPAFDFAANRLPPPWGRTYPIGLDTEVCSYEGLEQAWKYADQPHEREHVMPYFYDRPEQFRIRLVNHHEDLGHLRWTVDTPDDLHLLREIFARFDGRDDFSWLEVLALVKSEPALGWINAAVKAKNYQEFDKRIRGNEN